MWSKDATSRAFSELVITQKVKPFPKVIGWDAIVATREHDHEHGGKDVSGQYK